MKKRRIAIVCASLMAVSAVFGGCGSTAKEAGGTETAAGTQADTTQKGGTVSLKVWAAEEDAELMSQIIDSFKQEYGSQANFDITVEAQSESTCKDNLLGDVLNGADVFTFVDDQLMALVAAGALEPVEDAAAVSAANNENAVAASKVGDTLYAYPLTADNGYFMYYNKAYFSDSDVQSLDQMLAVAAANGKKVSIDLSSAWYDYAFFGNTGMELGLNDDGISNYCTWNSQDGAIKGIDVAQAMLGIATNPGFINEVDTDFLAGAENGSVIAGVSGVWNANALEQLWGENYGAAKLPTYTCAGQQVQMASFSGYKMVGVNAYSKNTEWAGKLADWITNEKNQTLRFEERGQGPANMNAANSAEVKASAAIQAVLAQTEYADLQRVGGNFWDPVQTFAEQIAAGNPNGEDLQKLLDTMVKGITASNGQ